MEKNIIYINKVFDSFSIDKLQDQNIIEIKESLLIINSIKNLIELKKKIYNLIDTDIKYLYLHKLINTISHIIHKSKVPFDPFDRLKKINYHNNYHNNYQINY